MTDPTHRANRFDAALPAVLLFEGSELECEAENLSRSGLLLTGRSDWPAADDVQLVLKSVTGHLRIPLAARVVRRIAPSDAGGPKLAVEFVGVDGAAREGLEFLVQRVIEGRAKSANLPEIPHGARPHEIRKILDGVALTIRVNLAGHGGPKEREHLIHDQHPAVLEALARNPGLLALEARGLAGSLHATLAVLTALLAEGRFAGDEELRVLILAHPKVPLPVAERLVASLGIPALRRAMAKPGTTPAARGAIQKKLVAGERRS